METAMRFDEGAGNGGPEIWERRARSTGLPKSVRILGEGSGEKGSTFPKAGDMVEFEVVKGNAAYREGERFFLTPAQAECAYFPTRRRPGPC